MSREVITGEPSQANQEQEHSLSKEETAEILGLFEYQFGQDPFYGSAGLNSENGYHSEEVLPEVKTPTRRFVRMHGGRYKIRLHRHTNDEDKVARERRALREKQHYTPTYIFRAPLLEDFTFDENVNGLHPNQDSSYETNPRFQVLQNLEFRRYVRGLLHPARVPGEDSK